MRSIVWFPRYDKNMKGVRIYPDTNSAWVMGFVGRNVFFNGEDVTNAKGRRLRCLRADMQIIFQDPYSSMNPRMLVGDIISEGLRAQGVAA